MRRISPAFAVACAFALACALLLAVAGCTTPVLQLMGERSPGPYPVMHEALAACLRATKRVTIPNAGHVMNVANPAAFDVAVLAFMAENR